MDVAFVGQNATVGNGDATEELVELLVVAHGQGDVARDNARLIVVTGGVASELDSIQFDTFAPPQKRRERAPGCTSGTGDAQSN